MSKHRFLIKPIIPPYVKMEHLSCVFLVGTQIRIILRKTLDAEKQSGIARECVAGSCPSRCITPEVKTFQWQWLCCLNFNDELYCACIFVFLRWSKALSPLCEGFCFFRRNLECFLLWHLGLPPITCAGEKAYIDRLKGLGGRNGPKYCGKAYLKFHIQ